MLKVLINHALGSWRLHFISTEEDHLAARMHRNAASILPCIIEPSTTPRNTSASPQTRTKQNLIESGTCLGLVLGGEQVGDSIGGPMIAWQGPPLQTPKLC